MPRESERQFKLPQAEASEGAQRAFQCVSVDFDDIGAPLNGIVTAQVLHALQQAFRRLLRLKLVDRELQEAQLSLFDLKRLDKDARVRRICQPVFGLMV